MSVPVDRVRVELGERAYDVIVGAKLLERAGEFLRPILRRPRIFVITDETVAAHHRPRLDQALRAAGIASPTIVLPPGEATKDLAHLGRLLDAILDQRPERGDVLLALGGGVIGDIVGLAASLTLRGIDFVQVPTTLLAQVDSSVGGKTGINTRHGKNLVGAFYQPRLVLADLDSLDTLPRRELLAGYAETVKYGLIDDAEFFGWCETNGAALLAGDVAVRQRAVTYAVGSKARTVTEDERETGKRALLNLGHTFGHALEAALGYSEALLHGEAVAVGMVLAFELSARLGLCPRADAARVRAHLASVGLPVAPPPALGRNTAHLLDLMAQDKKVRDGKVTFILARGIGRAFIERSVDPGAVRGVLESALAAA
ncbi:MAG TPA: 3-dehydroquinate synthase [Alphaproteobacteria bacterium]